MQVCNWKDYPQGPQSWIIIESMSWCWINVGSLLIRHVYQVLIQHHDDHDVESKLCTHVGSTLSQYWFTIMALIQQMLNQCWFKVCLLEILKSVDTKEGIKEVDHITQKSTVMSFQADRSKVAFVSRNLQSAWNKDLPYTIFYGYNIAVFPFLNSRAA